MQANNRVNNWTFRGYYEEVSENDSELSKKRKQNNQEGISKSNKKARK
jgi:hypothetical protein